MNDWTLRIGRHSVKLGRRFAIFRNCVFPATEPHRPAAVCTERTATASGSTPGGLGIASLLFGDVSDMSRYFSTSTTATEHQYRTFFYVQDNWKVSPKLTLNLGLRWEIYFPEAVNGKGMGGFYDLKTEHHSRRGIWKHRDQPEHPKQLHVPCAARWLCLPATPRTVLRGGYGRAFDPGFFGDIFGQLVTQTIPVLQNQQLSQLDGELYDAARNLDGTIFNIATGPSAPVNAIHDSPNGQIPLPPGISPTSRPDQMRIP